MKRKDDFSKWPAIYSIIKKKYAIFTIDTSNTSWDLSKPCVDALYILAVDYTKEKGVIGLSPPFDCTTTYWDLKILREGIFSFWGKVEKLLMEDGAFIRAKPVKGKIVVEKANLLQVQEEYTQKRLFRNNK